MTTPTADADVEYGERRDAADADARYVEYGYG